MPTQHQRLAQIAQGFLAASWVEPGQDRVPDHHVKFIVQSQLTQIAGQTCQGQPVARRVGTADLKWCRATVRDRDLVLLCHLASRVVHQRPPRRITGLAPNQPTRRILIADDTLENRVLLAQLLNTLGFEIREAGNGQAAILLAEQWHPHLILMDLRMPDMDGITAMRYIRNQEPTILSMDSSIVALKILAISASIFETDIEVLQRSGFDGFLGKPFQIETAPGAPGDPEPADDPPPPDGTNPTDPAAPPAPAAPSTMRPYWS